MTPKRNPKRSKPISRKTPPKRSPKPIARKTPPKRSSKPIARKTPPAAIRKRGGAREKAEDSAFSKRIRSLSPRCQIAKLCVGAIFPAPAHATDCAHLLPKSTHPTLRRNRWNAVAACRACHDYYTIRKEEWVHWVRARVRTLQESFVDAELAEFRAAVEAWMPKVQDQP